MYTPDPTVEKRIYVKISICFNEGPIDKVLYFRNDMKMEFFNRWKWFFRYRAAKYQVQNPKKRIIYEYGSYDYILQEVEVYEKVKNHYIAAKRKLTQAKNKLEKIKKEYGKIYVVETMPFWDENLKVIKQYEDKVEYWRVEFEKLGNNATK